MSLSFYSHGKLLITGEYAVLDGALSLAAPTRKGQSLTIAPHDGDALLWTSRDPDGHVWFETEFGREELIGGDSASDPHDIRGRLLHTLLTARKLNPEFLSGNGAFSVETSLEFPREWGLGSSSTLIHNLSQWAKTDPFELHRLSFGGSGYDIACAAHSCPILFQRNNGFPRVQEVAFNPSFAKQLYFVHLNRKQDSREAITAYRKFNKPREGLIQEVSGLTRKILASNTLQEFEKYIDAHENLISGMLGMPTIKESLFQDFTGSIKSLGAWGGDFILATIHSQSPKYFAEKGYNTIVHFNEMVL